MAEKWKDRGRTLPPPRVLFEDAHLMIVDKPVGWLSQGDRTGEPSLVDWARSHVGRNYVGLVHRLDRNTSGVMVLAKRSKAATRLTAALQEGSIARTYLAWVHGRPPLSLSWRHWVVKDRAANVVRVVPSGTPAAKLAVLRAKRVGSATLEGRRVSLLEIVLETGRSHQIRVQTAHEGFPIVGDRKYNSEQGPRGHRERAATPRRPALHSHRIELAHPMTGESLVFEAPLPREIDFRAQPR